MSQLSSLEDLQDLSGYKKDLKKSLDKVQASPAKMFYAQTFEFKGKKGPMVLVGEIPSGLTKGLKEARVTLKSGRCRRNERGELEVFKGLEPGKIGHALKSAGIAEQIAEKEIEDDSLPDEPTPEVAEQSPSSGGRMDRKMEFETAEFEKRSAAAYKTKEKDVLVEVQKFAGAHKDDPEVLAGIKDVKSQVMAARELATRNQFDEANSILDRILNAVRFTGAPARSGGPEHETGEPTVLGYSEIPEIGQSPSSPAEESHGPYGQPIPVKPESGPASSNSYVVYGQHIPVPDESGAQQPALYSVPDVQQPQASHPYGQPVPVKPESGPASNNSYVAYGQHVPVEDKPEIQRAASYSEPEIPASQARQAYGQQIPVQDARVADGQQVPVQPTVAQPGPVEGSQPPGASGPAHVSKEFVEQMKGIDLVKGKHGDAAQTDPNEFGFKTKQVGQEYVGEHEKAGWHAPRDPENKNYTTRRYTDEERKENTLDVDAEGNVRTADGKLANEDTEYVLDPKTGKMIKLKMRVEEVSKDSVTGETVRTPLSGQTVRQALQDGKKLESTHHSSPLGGYDMNSEGQPVRKGVAGAGGVEIKDGKVKKITNASGHYKPKLVQLLQTLEHLAKQGAILDKTIVDSEGRNLKDTNPKAFAVYGAVKKAGEKAKQLAADAKKMMAQMDESDSEEEVLALAGELDTINKTLLDIQAKTDAAAAMLRGIGAGPANKIDPGVEVDFVEGKDDLTGLQFHTDAKRTKSPASEFMKTGGGNTDQAQKKTAALNELKTRTAEERGQLDEDADRRADAMNTGPRVAPTETDFDKALKDLDYKADPAQEFEHLGGIPELEKKYNLLHPDNPYGWNAWSVEERIDFLKK